MKLKGKTPQNSELVETVNNQVYAVALALLRANGMVIFEEALIRSGQRKNRHHVQWNALREDLLSDTGRSVLLPVSYATLREQVDAKIDPLKVLADVAHHLHYGGKGNKTAGLCFAEAREDLARRQIQSRRHMAEGFQKSSNRIEVDLVTALPPPSPVHSLDMDGEH